MTSFTLGEIATLVGGQLHGDPSLSILGANTIREAMAGEITLADDPKYAAALADSLAVAVITNASFQPESHPHIVVDDVHQAFAKVVQGFRPPAATFEPGVAKSAAVDPTAQRKSVPSGSDSGVHQPCPRRCRAEPIS